MRVCILYSLAILGIGFVSTTISARLVIFTSFQALSLSPSTYVFEILYILFFLLRFKAYVWFEMKVNDKQQNKAKHVFEWIYEWTFKLAANFKRNSSHKVVCRIRCGNETKSKRTESHENEQKKKVISIHFTDANISFEVFLESIRNILFFFLFLLCFWQKAALHWLLDLSHIPKKGRWKKKNPMNIFEPFSNGRFVVAMTLMCRGVGGNVCRQRSNWKICDLFWIEGAKEQMRWFR